MAATRWFQAWRRKGKNAKNARKAPAKRRIPRAKLSLEGLELRQMMAAEIFVDPAGDDWALGTIEQPYQTIRRALDAAQPGDTITLRNGVYQGGINIDIDNLTIRSKPGEWAVLESPLTELTDGRSNSVIRYNYDVQGGRLENLEIAGGYWYGVMFWDWWDSDFSEGSTHVGASGITLDGVKVHDTGVDAIKITPGADDITIINSEIYNAGRRTTSSSDGIDNNNGDRMIVRNTYVHDIPGIGILTSGGTQGTVIEQNLVKDTAGAGIVAGFYSELEWIDPAANPGYYASIDTVVQNNIIVEAGHAGVGIYGALNAIVAHNTIVNAADDAQAPIQFGGYDMWVSDELPYFHATSVNPTVVNNIIVTDPDNLTRMVDIREDSITGPLTLDYNLYYGTSTRGVLFIDRNLTGDGTPEQTFSQWKANYGYDQHSIIADPKLDASWHLLANSPAIGRAISLAVTDLDFDGNLRPADPPDPDTNPPEPDLDPPEPDLGADEYDAGTVRQTPPAAFGAPSLEIAAKGYHDYEANTIVVRVVRHGSTADTVTVQFATLDGSAKAGLDYQAVSGQLEFLPGETEKTVAVSLLADTLPEGDEHFLFSLSDPTTNGCYPVRLGHQHSASMTIDDQQTPVTTNYRTLWVSNDGSDVTGDGSASSPWKSLQHAADNVGPGDYVIVKPGQYWGMNLTADGKADARITFYAMPGVVIDEPDPERRLDGINLEGADYVTIEGFETHDMPRAGLRSVNNTGVILRGNTTDHNGYWGILTGWSEDIVIENNVASRSQREHGIYVSNSADGAIVRNNVVWGNRASGIQFNADGSLPGDGVHSNNLIEGNVVYGNGSGGGAAINLDAVQDSVIQNNLLYDNHATGIVLYVGYGAEPSTNNVVRNNTVVMAEDARWALLLWNGSSGNVIENNILLNKNPNRGSITVEDGSEPALSNFNILQDRFDVNGYTVDFAAWQAHSGGQDAQSLVVPQASAASFINSLFVDPAAGDYRLSPNSAAIDAGDSSNAPSLDIYHHARPQGDAVDVGAFESGEFLPAVQFEWQDTIGYEFIGMAEVAVTRSGDSSQTMVVDITSADGTAIAGEDYEAVQTQIVFRPGETRKTFRVFVNDDSAIEDNETVKLNLKVVGDPTGLFPTDQATLNIASDDQWRPGRFEFDQSSVTFSEDDGMLIIVVRRVDGANGPASVDYSTEDWVKPRQATWIKRHTDLLYPTDNDSPATAGEDYVAQHGTLNFADGETEKTIAISLIDDRWFEGGEAFSVRLSDPTDGSTLGEQSQVKVRIESDDVKQPGTFVWAASAYEFTEGVDNTMTVTVNRVGGDNVAAAVRLYHTGAGNGSTTASAWAGSDYGFFGELLEFAPGETSKTIQISLTDDTSTEIDEVFSIQLYSPMNDATVGDPAVTYVTIHDNESTFYFQAPNGGWSYSAVEGSGNLPVTVVRQGSLTSPASVTVSTGSWGSATPGVDFTPVNVTLNFAAGESSKVVNIPLLNDTMMEPQESFPVNMSNVVGATQGSWSWSAYIVDDDVAASPGKLELSSANFSVNEAAGFAQITVNRVGGSDGTVTVKYSTTDGAAGYSGLTAWAGADYASTAGTLTFAPGETSKVFNVPITNDTSVEKNEVFTINLSTPGGGATLGATTKAVVTIVEDDSAIEFGKSSYTVDESAGVVLIKVIRKGSTAGSASIDLNISSSTATAGVDFLLPAGKTVTFEDGEAEKTITVQIIDDAFAEGDEWFNLSLTNALNARLGSSLWGNAKIAANDA